MTVYLLRHGETAYNAEKRYQGTRDVPLSPRGRAALRRAEFCPRVVYTSPLCRAAETARILFPGARLVAVPDLREMCFGDFEGRNYIEMGDDPDYRAWVEGNCLARPHGGMEDRAQFIARSCAAFAALADQALAEGQRRLVIVAHGGTQMAVLSEFARPRQDYYHWRVGNAAGFLLQVETQRWARERTLTVAGQVQYLKDE